VAEGRKPFSAGFLSQKSCFPTSARPERADRALCGQTPWAGAELPGFLPPYPCWAEELSLPSQRRGRLEGRREAAAVRPPRFVSRVLNL